MDREFRLLADWKALSARLPGQRRLKPPPPGLLVHPSGFSDVRLSDAGTAAGGPYLASGADADGGGPPNILALSGGAAGGAFGAGALVGLSQAGTRPHFQVVTGVSTGALIAPFAFLGPLWDERLTEAYSGPHAGELLGVRSFRPGVSGGLLAASALESLVARFINDELVGAVAEESRKGRRLLVATTNLDTQRTCVWDMGAIARHGGDTARLLFVDVLTASSSLPGLFPPRMIQVKADGEVFEEMHIDGGASSPLFVAPASLILRKGEDSPKGQVYAIFNTTLEPVFRETPVGVASVLVRSFELMLRSSYRAALQAVAGFCERHDLVLNLASLPQAFGGANMLKFDQASMSRTFNHGVERGRSGALWAEYPPPADASIRGPHALG